MAIEVNQIIEILISNRYYYNMISVIEKQSRKLGSSIEGVQHNQDYRQDIGDKSIWIECYR